MRILTSKKVREAAVLIMKIQKAVNNYDTISDKATQVEQFGKITEYLAELSCEVCGLEMSRKMADALFHSHDTKGDVTNADN